MDTKDDKDDDEVASSPSEGDSDSDMEVDETPSAKVQPPGEKTADCSDEKTDFSQVTSDMLTWIDSL